MSFSKTYGLTDEIQSSVLNRWPAYLSSIHPFSAVQNACFSSPSSGGWILALGGTTRRAGAAAASAIVIDYWTDCAIGLTARRA